MTDRLRAFAPLAVFGVAFALSLIASRLTGPAFEELPRLLAVERSEAVVRAIAGRGLGALVSEEARAVYASFDGRMTPLVLIGSWSKLSLGRMGALDPLTAARLPWLLLSSVGAVALFALVRPSHGRLAALLACAALWALPRWLHGVAVTSEGVMLASVWLLVLAAHVRSIGAGGPRRRVCWAVASAAALGLGLSLSLATLWLFLLIALHYAIAHFHELGRLVGRGRVPAPITLLIAIGVAPLVMLATNPALWKSNGPTLVRWVLAPLAPSISPTLHAGNVVAALPVPGGYAASWVLRTLPVAILLAALLGAAWLFHRALARRFASGSLRPRRDAAALGALFGLALAGALFGPVIAPDVLTTFPPRAELALPFVAAFAAIGLWRVASAQRPLIGRAIAFGIVGVTAIATLRAPATLGASFEPLFGGVPSVVRARAFPAGDGSELVVLAPALDRLGGAIAIHAPDVPSETWTVLRKAGRLKIDVTAAPGRGSGTLTLVRGDAPGEIVARVERGGARLWTLVR